MTNENDPMSRGSPAITPTLDDVLTSLETREDLSETRRRDLRSAVKRVAALLGDAPERIPLVMPSISAKLAKLSPAAAGVSTKTFHNLRSDFLAAVKASGLHSAKRRARAPLSPSWQALLQELSTRRAHLGLSRFARYASERGIAPPEVDDGTIEAFIATVRAETLHRKPNDLHRKVAQIWNEAAECSSRALQSVQVPSFKHPPQRVDWSTLSDSFRADVDRYLKWCAGTDMFATDARPRAMAPQTVRLRRDQIHAAVTALVEAGVPAAGIASLADLVSPENFKRILRHRYEMSAAKENVFNKDLARSLMAIAYQWAKIDEATAAELRRLVEKLPAPAPGLTSQEQGCAPPVRRPAGLAPPGELSTSGLGRGEKVTAARPLYARQSPSRPCRRHSLLHADSIAEPRGPGIRCAPVPEGGAGRGLEPGIAGERSEEQDALGVRYSASAREDADRIPRRYRAEDHRQKA